MKWRECRARHFHFEITVIGHDLLRDPYHILIRVPSYMILLTVILRRLAHGAPSGAEPMQSGIDAVSATLDFL